MQPCGQKDHVDPIKNYHTKQARTFRWKENRYESQESIVNNGQIGADTKKKHGSEYALLFTLSSVTLAFYICFV